MKTLSLVFAAALLASPVLAQETPAPPAPPAAPAAPVTPAPDKDAAGVYQVYRTTDNQLNCVQLTSEMNNLNAAIKKQAEADAKKGRGGGAGRQIAGGAAGGFLAGAARMGIARSIPGLGYAGAVAASAASDAAASATANAIANGGGQANAAPASASNEQQRLNRVAQLFGTKGC
ncbi:hypothetical protein BH11PSE2_BH11PSE2_17710 [soil metagenome]